MGFVLSLRSLGVSASAVSNSSSKLASRTEETSALVRLTNMKTHIFLAAVLALFATVPVFAKGRVERIVITGPGLDKPIEVSDPAILQKLNPWFGKLVGVKGQAPPPKASDSTYEVLFYMRSPDRHSELDRGELKLIYHVNYRPGAVGESGRIYFPGRDEKYHVNAATILRDGIDGTWQWASVDWDETMRPLMHDSKPLHPASTAVEHETRGTLAYATIGSMILAFAGVVAWRRSVIANAFLRRP